MTLTIGTGPFGEQSNGTFNFDTGGAKGAHPLPRGLPAAGAGDVQRADRRG
jgi:hypothetical protein